MRKYTKVILIFGLVAALLLVLFYCSGKIPRNEELVDVKSITVAGTIFPIYDIVQNITDGVSDVVLIVPAGSSPHTFTVSPSQIKDLNNTEVLFAVGEVDSWTKDLVRNTNDLEII